MVIACSCIWISRWRELLVDDTKLYFTPCPGVERLHGSWTSSPHPPPSRSEDTFCYLYISARPAIFNCMRQTSVHHTHTAHSSVCSSVPLGEEMVGMTLHRNSGRSIKATFQVPKLKLSSGWPCTAQSCPPTFPSLRRVRKTGPESSA